MATSSSRPRPCSDDWNACAVPWNDVVTLEGSVPLAVFSIASTASPSEVPGFRLNESVTEGSWPEWLTTVGPMVVENFAMLLSGTSCPDEART